MVKTAVERKETAWKEALGAGDEVAKGRCIEVYKEGRERLKGLFTEHKGGNDSGCRRGIRNCFGRRGGRGTGETGELQ